MSNTLLPIEPFRGFVDVYGRQARLEGYVAARLAQLFESWGYTPLRLPVLEHSECFSERVVGHSPWPEWDASSSFVVDVQDYGESYRDPRQKSTGLLIPEGTVSVCRWLARRVRDEKEPFPLKISYLCQCFRNEPVSRLTGCKRRQFDQVGMEVLGSEHAYADLETLHLIGEGLASLGVPRAAIRHRVSDIGLFSSLAADRFLDEPQRIALKECLDAIAEHRAGGNLEAERRRRDEYRGLLASCGISGNAALAWGALADTVTDGTMPGRVRELLPADILDRIEARVSEVRRLGFNAVCDLAVVRSHEYYTGLTMEVDVELDGRVFVEVAGGGRYDRLIGAFLGSEDVRVPAVGFAYGVQRLTEFVRAGTAPQTVRYWLDGDTDVVLPPSASYRVDQSVAQSYRDRGQRADLFVGDNPSTLVVQRYAQRMGAVVHEAIGTDDLDQLFEPPYDEIFLQRRGTEARDVSDLMTWLGIAEGVTCRFLDVACGIGRHSVELAQRGQSVVGVDRSSAFLSLARARAASAGVEVDFREGDVRWFHAEPEAFDHGVCLYNSLGYYDERTDLSLLLAIRRTLRPGGTLTVEVVNRDFILQRYQPQRWWSAGETRLLEKNSFDAAASRSLSEYCYVPSTASALAGATPGGGDALPGTFRCAFRVYSLHEVIDLFARAGFADVKVGSTFAGAPFLVTDSPCMVVCGRKSG